MKSWDLATLINNLFSIIFHGKKSWKEFKICVIYDRDSFSQSRDLFSQVEIYFHQSWFIFTGPDLFSKVVFLDQPRNLMICETKFNLHFKKQNHCICREKRWFKFERIWTFVKTCNLVPFSGEYDDTCTEASF